LSYHGRGKLCSRNSGNTTWGIMDCYRKKEKMGLSQIAEGGEDVVKQTDPREGSGSRNLSIFNFEKLCNATAALENFLSRQAPGEIFGEIIGKGK